MPRLSIDPKTTTSPVAARSQPAWAATAYAAIAGAKNETSGAPSLTANSAPATNTVAIANAARSGRRPHKTTPAPLAAASRNDVADGVRCSDAASITHASATSTPIAGDHQGEPTVFLAAIARGSRIRDRHRKLRPQPPPPGADIVHRQRSFENRRSLSRRDQTVLEIAGRIPGDL